MQRTHALAYEHTRRKLLTHRVQIGDGIIRGFGWGLGMRFANELVNACCRAC